MQYTIKAVNPQVRSYETKFGPMASYKVLFEGDETPVEISQKATSPVPQVGDTVEGSIDMSAPYGPKFKKEFSGGFGGGGSQQAGSAAAGKAGGKFQSDPFTMYLSYSKDVAVALLNTKEGFTEEKFSDVLEAVITGGKTLYGSRPGAEETEEKKEERKVADEPFASSDQAELPPDVAALFDKVSPENLDSVWPDDKK